MVNFNRQSHRADKDSRESYRQRLNEILEAGESIGGGVSSPPEALVSGVRPETEESLKPVVLVRIEEPAVPSVEAGSTALQGPIAAAAPAEVGEREAPLADVFGKAAERITESFGEFWSAVTQNLDRHRQAGEARLQAASHELKRIQGEVAELRDGIGAQQRLLETQVLVALAGIDQRLGTLDKTVQSQAHVIARLGAADEQLEQALGVFRQRLDTQAVAVRDLRNAVAAQQSRWSQYRSAVEKLREISDVALLPVQLPENL